MNKIHKGAIAVVLSALTWYVLLGWYNPACVRPPNIATIQKQIIAYYECGCLEKELDQALAQGKALFKERARHEKQVVIFDIDETAITEYCNTRAISFGYIPSLADEWAHKGTAKVIPQMLALYRFLQEQGYKIVFLTGRPESQREATLAKLEEEGYTNSELVLLRPCMARHMPAAPFKEKMRLFLVEQGYEIVGSIGDQISDMSGLYVGKTLKLPNYMYVIE
jgi:acid phosphatase